MTKRAQDTAVSIEEIEARLDTAFLLAAQAEQQRKDAKSKIETAEADIAKAREDWINATLTLCEALVLGRKKFKSNKEFGDWLDQTSLRRIKPTDRAALIQLGENFSLTKKALAESDSWSWQLIWTGIVQPQVPVSSANQARKRRQIAAVPSAPETLAGEDIAVRSDQQKPAFNPDAPARPWSMFEISAMVLELDKFATVLRKYARRITECPETLSPENAGRLQENNTKVMLAAQSIRQAITERRG